MDENTVLAPGGGRPFVGKYLIESTLGEGAMGVVYAGLDPDIQRPVAIKTIHAHLMQTPDRTELLERFAREARAAGRVLHPNLVTIFDFLLEDGMPYLVMECVQSVTLKGHCTDAARLSLREIHNLARQMLAGLAAIFTEAGVLLGLAPPVDGFLAFAPGGQAEMTVLAIVAGADLGYVIVHHITRVVVVITGAPIAARLLRVHPQKGGKAPPDPPKPP